MLEGSSHPHLIYCCNTVLLQLFVVANALFIIYLLTQRHTLTIHSVRFKWVKHIELIYQRTPHNKYYYIVRNALDYYISGGYYSVYLETEQPETNTHTVWCWWHYIRRRWIMCSTRSGRGWGQKSPVPHTNYGYCLINFSTHNVVVCHHKCKIIPAAHFYFETWELWHL